MPSIPETTPFFFYGTLQDDDLLRLVTDRSSVSGLDISAAALADHAVERVAGHVFPMIFPRIGHQAGGRLVGGLTARERERIAFFEDSDYRLEPIEVVAGSTQRAAAVFTPTARIGSSGELWRLSDWPAADKALLMACAEEQMSYFGVHPQELVETWWPDIEARARARLGAD